MTKILISDAMDNVVEDILKSKNIDVDIITNLSNYELIKNIHKYDGLIVRSATKVTKEILDAAKNLKIIGRAGAGVDNIDIVTAKKKNIIVMNTPGGNTNATAEHTLALIFAISRSIPESNNSTHKGLWEKKKFKGIELKGKSIGIIGFGNVGKRIAEICFSLGMKINIFSMHFESIKNDFKNYENLNIENLIKNSDFISLHCKPLPNGKPIISMNELKLMKKNSIIINTARGGLIDENDLKKALDQNIIKGAAIDVFNNEPAKENILFGTKNIILTPHIAASTAEAQIIVAEKIANQFCKYFINGEIINSV